MRSTQAQKPLLRIDPRATLTLVLCLMISSVATAQPAAPSLVSPGSATAPGPTISDTTPTFQWQSVSGATDYGFYVSRHTGGGNYSVVFDSESAAGTITGTSYTLPSGVVTSGNEYRWNARAHNWTCPESVDTQLSLILQDSGGPRQALYEPRRPAHARACGRSRPTVSFQAFSLSCRSYSSGLRYPIDECLR